MVLLEKFKENHTESHNGQEWEDTDSQDIEKNITSEILVEQFRATLSNKDITILEMRMERNTLEDNL